MDRRQFLQLLAAAPFAGTSRAASALHVVVAGAGIIGASIAWHLAKARARVTVIDREGPATHASRGSFAWINATWSKQPQRYHRLNQAGVEGWRALGEELKLPVRWGGSLEGVADAALEAALPARVAEQLAWGEKTRLVDRVELASLEPNVDFGTLRQVVFSGNDGATDPIAATRAFLGAATELGAIVAYPCELTGVAISNGRLSAVQTSRGDIAADRLVLATGAAADASRRFADWDLPQRSAPGLTAITTPMRRIVERVLWLPGVHMHQRADGRLVIGEEAGPPANEAHAARLAGRPDAFPTREIELEHAERLRGAALKYVPRLGPLNFEHVRICHRPMPLDGYPVLGASPSRPDIYLAVTHSGVTLAPVVGALVAQELVNGAAAESLEDFRPDRKFTAGTGH